MIKKPDTRGNPYMKVLFILEPIEQVHPSPNPNQTRLESSRGPCTRESLPRTATISRVEVVRAKEHQFDLFATAPSSGSGDRVVLPALGGL